MWKNEWFEKGVLTRQSRLFIFCVFHFLSFFLQIMSEMLRFPKSLYSIAAARAKPSGPHREQQRA